MSKDETMQLTLFQESLFEQLCKPAFLKQAWQQVKVNRGAAGVDRVSIEEYGARLNEELNQLSKELRGWKYTPEAVLRVEIPKPGSKEKRKLGIPTVRDRVVQQGLKILLEPHFEPEFSDSSYGFRPGRGQQDAIKQAKRLAENGKDWVVDIDLEKFFDRINQDRVIHLLRQKVRDNKILRLVGLTLRSGIFHDGHLEKSEEGTPQGSPLSPLLSNIVLDELDKELEKRGLEFSRYADDAKIYVGSRKSGERVMRSISTFIEKRLKLAVNQTKSKVAQAKDVVFLGFVVTKEFVTMSWKSYKRAMSKTKELIKRGAHKPFKEQLEKVNQWYVGWASYYKMTEFPAQLHAIEAHIRRRFRAQFVKNQKREKSLAKRLQRQGVLKGRAYCAAYSNKGCWAMSHAKAVEEAWSNKWFEEEGFKVQSDKELSHWKPVRTWLKPL